MRNPGAMSKNLGGLLIVVAVGLIAPLGSMAQTRIPVDAFQTITLEGGGEVVVRHGSSQRVTLVKGRMECTSVTVEDGALVIEGPHGRCRGERELTIEVVTPEIDELMVTNGGTLRSVGGFPIQKELVGLVDNGGRLDIRSMKAQVVHAAVRQGGGIFTKPQVSLFAKIEQGGAVTYWGNPDVHSRINHGGAVAKGKPGDVSRPLDEIGPGAPPPPPPVPPVPPEPPDGR